MRSDKTSRNSNSLSPVTERPGTRRDRNGLTSTTPSREENECLWRRSEASRCLEWMSAARYRRVLVEKTFGFQ